MKTATVESATTEDAAIKDDQNAKELARQERVIQKGQKAFLDSAKAVLTIVQDELFKPKFKSKTEYFSERWDMSGSDITRYTNAGEILELLEKEGFDEFPTNEGQARALAEIKGVEKRVEVWRNALDSGEKISARLLKELASPPTPESAEGAESAPSDAGDTESQEQESVSRSTKCSAVITVDLDSSVLANALEFNCVPCNRLGEVEWQFKIVADSKPALLNQLANWSEVYSVTKFVITFE